MDEKTIKAIESALDKGDRIELIPVKDGVKIIHIRREVMATWTRKNYFFKDKNANPL